MATRLKPRYGILYVLDLLRPEIVELERNLEP